MKQSVAGSSISPTLGNGIAYFTLWYLAQKHGVTFADPEMALVFAGGIVGSVLLELRRLGAGIVLLVGKIWGPKNAKPDSNN